jgi:hypothetical protein
VTRIEMDALAHAALARAMSKPPPDAAICDCCGRRMPEEAMFDDDTCWWFPRFIRDLLIVDDTCRACARDRFDDEPEYEEGDDE